MSEAAHSYDVVVVGGGVSGTACALSCAEAGCRVAVVSSSLDIVGQPGYGPVVGSVPAEWGKALQELPRGIARAWGNELLVERRGGVAVVDPRRLSLRLKWELEATDRIDIRQGLVVAVDEMEAAAGRAPLVRVRTALEEELVARACVLAPGLALRGRCLVGRQTLHGGRYGEVAADDLSDHLRRIGVRAAATRVEVGACYRSPEQGRYSGAGGPTDPWWHCLSGAGGFREAELELLRPAVALGSVCDGLELRRATTDLDIAPPPRRPGRALVQADGRGLFPAGEALDEWYLSPGLDPAPLLSAGFVVSRPSYVVMGERVLGDPACREQGCLVGTTPLWAAGRALGHSTCWESLLSGHSVVQRVLCHLSEVGRR